MTVKERLFQYAGEVASREEARLVQSGLQAVVKSNGNGEGNDRNSSNGKRNDYVVDNLTGEKIKIVRIVPTTPWYD